MSTIESVPPAAVPSAQAFPACVTVDLSLSGLPVVHGHSLFAATVSVNRDGDASVTWRGRREGGPSRPVAGVSMAHPDVHVAVVAEARRAIERDFPDGVVVATIGR